MPEKNVHVVFGSGPLGLAVTHSLVGMGRQVRIVNRSGVANVGLAIDSMEHTADSAFGLVDEAQVDLVQQDGFGWTMLGKMVTKMKCHAASRAEGERMRQ